MSKLQVVREPPDFSVWRRANVEMNRLPEVETFAFHLIQTRHRLIMLMTCVLCASRHRRRYSRRRSEWETSQWKRLDDTRRERDRSVRAIEPTRLIFSSSTSVLFFPFNRILQETCENFSFLSSIQSILEREAKRLFRLSTDECGSFAFCFFSFRFDQRTTRIRSEDQHPM